MPLPGELTGTLLFGSNRKAPTTDVVAEAGGLASCVLFRTHFRRPRKGVVPSCLRHLYLFVPLERTNGQKERMNSRGTFLNFVFVSWQPNVAPASSPIRRDAKGVAVRSRSGEHRAVANRCMTCYLVDRFRNELVAL